MDLVLSSSQDLHDVRQLAASSGAFAAICGPCGRVVAWGSKSYGGDAGRVQAMIFFSKKNLLLMPWNLVFGGLKVSLKVVKDWSIQAILP